jgi:general secretion pathway protein G
MIYSLRSTIRRGFTLIELLVVIAIIGILSSLIFTNLVSARERARDARRKADLEAIGQSLRLYYNDNQAFPTSTNNAITGHAWGSSFTNMAGTTTYMNLLPSDPSSTSTATKYYSYYSSPANTDNYLLVASLENGSDPDITTSQSRCSSLYSNYKSAGGPNTTTDYLLCTQ